MAFLSTIGGAIDRLDLVADKEGRQHIRVIDYKTGGGRFENNLDSVEEIFDSNNIKSHSDYYLQTFIYSSIVRHSQEIDAQSLPVSPSLLFIQHFKDDFPTLRLGGEPIADVNIYEREFRSCLDKLLSDIFNPSLPFQPTTDSRSCAYCPFIKICH